MGKIAYKIEKLLEAKGISKTVFAEKIGVSRDTVYNWTDENLKISTLQKISDVLDVPITYFLFENVSANRVNDPAEHYGTQKIKLTGSDNSIDLADIKQNYNDYRQIIKELTQTITKLTAHIEIIDKQQKTKPRK